MPGASIRVVPNAKLDLKWGRDVAERLRSLFPSLPIHIPRLDPDGPIPQRAGELLRFIENIRSPEKVHLIAHSMGRSAVSSRLSSLWARLMQRPKLYVYCSPLTRIVPRFWKIIALRSISKEWAIISITD